MCGWGFVVSGFELGDSWWVIRDHVVIYGMLLHVLNLLWF